MGGSIQVDSQPDAGATFSFTVPLAPPDADTATKFVAPDLQGAAVLIVSGTEIEASLLARRLGRWGAKTCAVIDEKIAYALLPERHWDALLVDYPLAAKFAANVNLARLDAPRRIVLTRPTERHELAALRELGFNGYLIKPVRAASLAAQLQHSDGFEQPQTETAAANAEAGNTKTGKSLSILVAEDNEINALLARALLTRLGHRPTIAANGEAAVESWLAARAGGTPYDLVLMDVQMPGVDGLEAARRIRAAEAESDTPRTRMLALTANAQSEDRAACLAAGMDGLLVKPLDRERLREALAAASTALAA